MYKNHLQRKIVFPNSNTKSRKKWRIIFEMLDKNSLRNIFTFYTQQDYLLIPRE